jgi:ATP-binding cassette subfamily F protein 3
MSGEMRHHKQLSVGYFAQHQLDELDASRSPYDYFRGLMPGSSEAQRRAKLGAYGFGAATSDTKCASLSGGEKARLLFALASFQAPHVLVLDEPTNHLDVDSREALIHAINDYEGCVVLISHDRHLIETTVDRLWLVAKGTVTSYEGDIEDYTSYVLEQARAGRRGNGNSRQSRSGGMPEVDGEPRRNSMAVLKKIREIEAGILQLQEKIGVLDRALADERLYSDAPQKAQRYSRLRAELQDDLEAFELRWLEAHGELEGMKR